MVVPRFVALVVGAFFALAPLVAAETCTSLEFDVDSKDVTTVKIPAACVTLKLDGQGITDDMAAAIATALIAAPAQFKQVLAAAFSASYAEETFGVSVAKVAAAYREQVVLDFECFARYAANESAWPSPLPPGS